MKQERLNSINNIAADIAVHAMMLKCYKSGDKSALRTVQLLRESCELLAWICEQCLAESNKGGK
jgi:hypothetical protein